MFQRLLFLVLVIALSACSTPNLKVSESETNALKIEARESNSSANDLLVQYQNKVKALDESSLRFYSPLNMSAAQKNLNLAQDFMAISKANSEEHAKFHLISALRFIDKASQNKIASKLHLKKANAHFKELKQLQAEHFFPDDFNDVESEFTSLITLIELGETQKAISLEEDLIEKFLALEIKTLIKNYLGKSQALIDQALALKAEKFAPSSLQTADASLNKTQEFIRKAYRNRHEINIKASHTEKLAKRLFFVTEEAYKLHSSSYAEVEASILNNFTYLNELSKILGETNSDERSLTTQKENVATLLKTQLTQLHNNPELEKAKEENNALKAQIKQLEQAAIFQKRTVISEETNKAVLPELFNQTYPEEVLLDDESEF